MSVYVMYYHCIYYYGCFILFYLFLAELLRAGAEPQGALRHRGGGGAP
jgi:hypothetical protein